MRKINKIKLLFLLIFYSVLYPISLIVFQLIPYILANNTDVAVISLVKATYQHLWLTTQTILASNLRWGFIAAQIIMILFLYAYLHPKKRETYQVVGRSKAVHGGAFWGTEAEIDTKSQIHLIRERKLRRKLKRVWKGVSHE